MSYGYVCNTTDGTVSKIDFSTFSVVGTPLSGITGAYCVVMDAAEAFAYVTNGTSVYQIDLSTFTISNTLTPGGLFVAQYLCLDPTDTFLYVGGIGGFDLYKIDLSTFTVVGSGLPIASNITGIAIDPAGAFAYVAAYSGGTSYLKKVDLGTFTVAASLTGFSTGGVVVDDIGAYAYGLGVQVDLSTFTISGTSSPTSIDIDGVAIDPGASVVVITEGNINSILFYTPLVPFTVGGGISVSGNPRQIAIDSSGTYAYTTDSTSASVTKIDIFGFSVVGSIAVGNGPYGIAARPHYSPPVTDQICMVV